MSESVSFLASFPAIQSAIKLDGAGGARIQLDIPESEMGNFISAMMWRGKRLRVTITPCITGQGKEQDGGEFNELAEGRKRKSEWRA